jgi:hypothetical protein
VSGGRVVVGEAGREDSNPEPPTPEEGVARSGWREGSGTGWAGEPGAVGYCTPRVM